MGYRVYLFFSFRFVLAVLVFSSVVGQAAAFDVDSTSFKRGGVISERYVLNGFGCAGDNISPALRWNDAPNGTKSFALTMYDPDAPSGSGWWHWVVVNIPVDVTRIAEGRTPRGALETRTDFGTPGYGGPCPPEGAPAHRYIFTIHALDTENLELSADASGAMAGFMINQHSLGKAVFEAKYGR